MPRKKALNSDVGWVRPPSWWNWTSKKTNIAFGYFTQFLLDEFKQNSMNEKVKVTFSLKIGGQIHQIWIGHIQWALTYSAMDYFPSLCDKSRLLLQEEQFTFQQFFLLRTASLGSAFAFCNLLHILAIFVFQKTCQSITHVVWKNSICTTFIFQGRHCPQPSSQARVTSY